MGELELELNSDPKPKLLARDSLPSPVLFGFVFPPGSLLHGSLKLSELCPGLLSCGDMNYCWERLGCGGVRGAWGRGWGCGTSRGHGEGDPRPQS